jgi:hypothetical protein
VFDDDAKCIKPYSIKTYCIFLTICLLASAQSPDTLWTRTYGGAGEDVGYSVQQTFDGGYIITGYTTSFGIGGSDIYLIKTDAFGDVVWTKTYGRIDNDCGHEVQQTPDSGYVVAGYRGQLIGMPEFHDVCLLRTDEQGDSIFLGRYGCGWGDEHGHSVKPTSDGGYIVCAVRNEPGVTNGADIWQMRMDTLGFLLWYVTHQDSADDYGYSVQIANDSCYVFAGHSSSSGAGGFDVWFLKTNNYNGDPIWSKRYGGISDDHCHSIELTPDGGYIAVGYTRSFGFAYAEVWLLKLDAMGDTQWTNTFGYIHHDRGYSVAPTSDGGYIVAGSRGCFEDISDLWVIRTDSQGDTMWTKTLGGGNDEVGYSVQQTSDGGYIICGYTSSNGAGNRDVWLIKLAPETYIKEKKELVAARYELGPSIVRGPLLLPGDSKCQIFDITGRKVDVSRMIPGVYYILEEGKVVQKIIKIK